MHGCARIWRASASDGPRRPAIPKITPRPSSAAFAGLIDGAFGAPLGLDAQKDFYVRHVQSWLPIFFRDLEAVTSSKFYSALGSVGRAFLDIEDGAFEMV